MLPATRQLGRLGAAAAGIVRRRRAGRCGFGARLARESALKMFKAGWVKAISALSILEC